MQLRGRDPIAVPVARPVVAAAAPAEAQPAAVVPIDIPALSMARGIDELPGVLMGQPAIPGGSRGPGSGPGAGDGKGPGMGAGDGPGLGPGKDGGLGGDVRSPGHGVSDPVLVHEVRPNYTNEALQAKVQGLVALDAVVLPDGSVGPVQVVRSLDRMFGLDREAVLAVRQWRFRPGLYLGRPVPVRISIELTFTLR